jgi:hypothetical protein
MDLYKGISDNGNRAAERRMPLMEISMGIVEHHHPPYEVETA